MYAVETDSDVLEQLAELPDEALPFYAELMALLEITPWSGDAYNRERPLATMLTHLILEEQRRVIVLRVLWVA